MKIKVVGIILITLFVFPLVIFAEDENKGIEYWRLRALAAEALLDNDQKRLTDFLEEEIGKIYDDLSDSCLVFKFDDRIGWDNRIGTLVITQGQYNAIIMGRPIKTDIPKE